MLALRPADRHPRRHERHLSRVRKRHPRLRRNAPWFDTSSRFECGQPIPARVRSKQSRNTCTFFEVRVTVERQTHSSVGPRTARQAFDDLFK